MPCPDLAEEILSVLQHTGKPYKLSVLTAAFDCASPEGWEQWEEAIDAIPTGLLQMTIGDGIFHLQANEGFCSPGGHNAP